MFWRRSKPCPAYGHVWGPGKDADHRACEKCRKEIKLEWVEPHQAPALNPDDIVGINNGGGIMHVPTGCTVVNGDGRNFEFFMRQDAMREELARRVEVHLKEKS